MSRLHWSFTDAETLQELVEWRAPIIDMSGGIIGSTLNPLDGRFESCRLHECSLGELMIPIFAATTWAVVLIVDYFVRSAESSLLRVCIYGSLLVSRFLVFDNMLFADSLLLLSRAIVIVRTKESLPCTLKTAPTISMPLVTQLSCEFLYYM